jgi:PTS system mannose-specific IIA component
MIGLVIVTHGALAREFRAAMEHVVGAQKQIETVQIGPEDNMELRRGEIVEAIAHTDSGDGVIVLTDMFGGTPSNLAISVMTDANVEVIAGINLPILVKLARLRTEVELKEAVRQARDAGRKYIKVASQELSGET